MRYGAESFSINRRYRYSHLFKNLSNDAHRIERRKDSNTVLGRAAAYLAAVLIVNAGGYRTGIDNIAYKAEIERCFNIEPGGLLDIDEIAEGN